MKLQLLPSLTSLPCIDLTSSILVNPAHTWESLCGLRDPKRITTAVVHHDAIKKATHPNKTALEYASIIANGHMNIKTDHPEGEPGNPYQIMIRNGQSYQINNLLAYTYGVSGHNGNTIHVCVAGEYRYTDTISDEDYNMLATVLVSLLKSPDLPNLKVIKGHRELDSTECPGIDLGKLREDVLNIQKQMEYAESVEGKNALAYNIAQTILWTYNTAKGLDQFGKPTVIPEDRDWARQRLLLLEPAMREHKFL